MKKKTITTLMIGMLGFGVICSNAIAATTSEPDYAKNPVPAADARLLAPCGPGMWHQGRGMGFRMNERLNLSREQQESFRDLRRKYFDQSITERRHLRDLKKELAEESLKKNPDQKKINALADTIGKEHSKLARTESRFFGELSSILTPEQAQTFLKMKEQRMHGV
jgi:Spy/CpxP family protein refolding chaperone